MNNENLEKQRLFYIGSILNNTDQYSREELMYWDTDELIRVWDIIRYTDGDLSNKSNGDKNIQAEMIRIINSLNKFTEETGIIISSSIDQNTTVTNNKRVINSEIKVKYDYEKQKYVLE